MTELAAFKLMLDIWRQYQMQRLWFHNWEPWIWGIDLLIHTQRKCHSRLWAHGIIYSMKNTQTLNISMLTLLNVLGCLEINSHYLKKISRAKQAQLYLHKQYNAQFSTKTYYTSTTSIVRTWTNTHRQTVHTFNQELTWFSHKKGIQMQMPDMWAEVLCLGRHFDKARSKESEEQAFKPSNNSPPCIVPVTGLWRHVKE